MEVKFPLEASTERGFADLSLDWSVIVELSSVWRLCQTSPQSGRLTFYQTGGLC